MRIAFDIGGVLSKYPDQLRTMARMLHDSGAELYVITDMHVRSEVVQILEDNGFGFIQSNQVHCADYAGCGEFCKAILCRDLSIDVLIDDFGGYVQWDSSLGPAPIRLLVAPDGFKPYWHESWKVKDQHDFGRRVTSLDKIRKSDDAR